MSDKDIRGLGIAVRIVWLIVGLLALPTLGLAVNILVNVHGVVEDARQTFSLVTIEDMRQTLDIVEKQLDISKLELEIEELRTGSPLEWTFENWEAFLDFCDRTGYTPIGRNWQEWVHGRLKD